MPDRRYPILLFSILLLLVYDQLKAQMITGAWKGKINRQKVEVKIIQSGDSLTGTSYYYESSNNYRRYTIKGYFDPGTNSAVWWDDRLLEEKAGRLNISTPGKMPLLSRADFNCPGGNRMMLDGKATRKDNNNQTAGEVHLDKIINPEFEDEWDYVIDNFTIGANDPYIIDSIEMLSSKPVDQVNNPVTIPIPQTSPQPPVEIRVDQNTKKESPKTDPAPIINLKPATIEEKFVTRKKVLTKEIPITGDSIELRFYDNAEIDGDSISLFLNGKLLLEHIRLSGTAYSIKLAVNELGENNELIMVAENLGAIPPNTSYMVAIVGENRHDAYLSSSEGSSAMIRFVKK